MKRFIHMVDCLGRLLRQENLVCDYVTKCNDLGKKIKENRGMCRY